MTAQQLRFGWAVIGVAGLALEAIALRDQAQHHAPRSDAYTLSATTSAVFNTATPPGRIAWVVAWRVFTNWYEQHILD